MNRFLVRKYLVDTVVGPKPPRLDRQYWFFTLNNPEDNDVRFKLIDVEIVFWQRERAPTTGTPYLQGVIKFINPKTLAQVRSMLPRAHLQRIWSNFETAVGYCLKSHTREAGPWAGFGADTDLTCAWGLLRTTQAALKRPIPAVDN